MRNTLEDFGIGGNPIEHPLDIASQGIDAIVAALTASRIENTQRLSSELLIRQKIRIHQCAVLSLLNGVMNKRKPY